jgi:hypothetical protein
MAVRFWLSDARWVVVDPLMRLEEHIDKQPLDRRRIIL